MVALRSSFQSVSADHTNIFCGLLRSQLTICLPFEFNTYRYHVDIYGVGHSLGSHVMGWAGRSGHLTRITGLFAVSYCVREEQEERVLTMEIKVNASAGCIMRHAHIFLNFAKIRQRKRDAQRYSFILTKQNWDKFAFCSPYTCKVSS